MLKAFHGELISNFEENDRVETPPFGLQMVVEEIGLAGGAREAIEDDPCICGNGEQPLGDHGIDQFVRGEFSAIDAALGEAAESGLVGDVFAKEVPGAEWDHSKPAGNFGGQCAFACARRADQRDIH